MSYEDMSYQEENSLTSIETSTVNIESSKAEAPGNGLKKLARHINWRRLRTWLCTWEIYVIVLMAGFLRFYQISTSEFDADQAIVFGMAHDAIYHGLIPATSNIASIRIVNPPAVIYIFMLMAAFTANPLWGVILVALFNVVAVLLTYVFVRRYYGRLAGIVAALLYGTAATPLYYSRFIWQQNLIAPFVVLFLFALFWGAVERRRGWLFPALLLLGILIQLHETTILLLVPLLAALLLAPGTLRWRDLIAGLIALFLLFFTYLLWEVGTNFNDLHVLLRLAKHSSHCGIKSECTSTALRAGDQLIVALNVPYQSTASLLPTSSTINGWYFTTMPFNLSYGPLALETIRDQRGSLTMLRTPDGASSIIVPVSP